MTEGLTHPVNHEAPRVVVPAQVSPHSLANRAARMTWGIVYLFLFRTSLKPMHGWRRFLLRVFGAKLHPTSRVYPRARVWAPWRLTMGKFACVADDVDVYNVGGITIGENAIISQYTYLCGATHDHTRRDFPLIPLPIVIGQSAWIAADVFIAPGVTIGDGTVVGARSSVFADLPPWVVAVGSPAKPIKPRNLRD